MLLAVRRYTEGALDAHGNAIGTFDPPEDWFVYGIAPGSQEEPALTNRDLSVVEWTVYAPANTDAPTERDLVVVDDEEFAVDGRPADWTRGPGGAGNAGIVVELRRAEG